MHFKPFTPNQVKDKQWELKKAQGLCFKYNEKFFPRYQCKGKMLNNMEVTKEEQVLEE